MKPLLLCALLATSAPAFTQTSAPAAPTLTASAQFKGLGFKWAPVAGATSYQLEYRAHQTGAFSTIASFTASTTSTGFSFPLHLYDWTYARYRLAACNSAGCSRSPAISVSTLRLKAVGYFKTSNTMSFQQFGADVDLSPDGYNFVAAAAGEAVSGGGNDSGALYVFRRANGAWTQRAQLTPVAPPYQDSNRYKEQSVAISANGNTVAVGLGAFEHVQNDPGRGEVEVFNWNGTTWTHVQVPRVPSSVFGDWVELADSGLTLAVGYFDEGNYSNSKVAIYKSVNGAWQNVRTITGRTDNGETCKYGRQGHAFSRDGSTVAQVCALPRTSDEYFDGNFIRVYSGSNWATRTDVPLASSFPSTHGYDGGGIGMSANGDTIAANVVAIAAQTADEAMSQVNVFKRSGGVYTQVATLTPGPWADGTYRYAYGAAIAVSGNGETIGVGQTTDAGYGLGPRAAPLNPGGQAVGAVYVYRLTNSWKLANMVKPNYRYSVGYESFGGLVALSGSGKTLLIGNDAERSGSVGIGSDWHRNDATDAGAVWMY
jgi:hypothetical protein